MADMAGVEGFESLPALHALPTTPTTPEAPPLALPVGSGAHGGYAGALVKLQLENGSLKRRLVGYAGALEDVSAYARREIGAAVRGREGALVAVEEVGVLKGRVREIEGVLEGVRREKERALERVGFVNVALERTVDEVARLRREVERERKRRLELGGEADAARRERLAVAAMLAKVERELGAERDARKDVERALAAAREELAVCRAELDRFASLRPDLDRERELCTRQKELAAAATREVSVVSAELTAAERRVAELQGATADVGAKLAAAERELALAADARAHVEARDASAAADAARVAAELASVRDQAVSVARELQREGDERAALAERHAGVESELAESKECIAAVKGELAGAEQRLEALARDAAARDARAADDAAASTAELDDARARLAAACAELEELRAAVATHSNEIVTTREAHDGLSAQAADLRQSLADAEEKITRAGDDAKAAADRIAELVVRSNAAEAELGSARAEVAATRDGAIADRSAHQAVTGDLARVTDELKTARAAQDGAQAEIQQLKDAQAAAREEYVKLEMKLHSESGELVATKRERDSLLENQREDAAAKTQLAVEVSTAREEAAAKRSALDALAREQYEFTLRMGRMAADLDRANADATAVREQLAGANSDLCDLQDAKAAKEVAETKCRDLERELEFKSNEVKNKATELDSVTNWYTLLKEDVARDAAEMSTMRTDLDATRGHLLDATTSLEQMRVTVAEQIALGNQLTEVRDTTYRELERLRDMQTEQTDVVADRVQQMQNRSNATIVDAVSEKLRSELLEEVAVALESRAGSMLRSLAKHVGGFSVGNGTAQPSTAVHHAEASTSPTIETSAVGGDSNVAVDAQSAFESGGDLSRGLQGEPSAEGSVEGSGFGTVRDLPSVFQGSSSVQHEGAGIAGDSLSPESAFGSSRSVSSPTAAEQERASSQASARQVVFASPSIGEAAADAPASLDVSTGMSEHGQEASREMPAVETQHVAAPAEAALEEEYGEEEYEEEEEEEEEGIAVASHPTPAHMPSSEGTDDPSAGVSEDLGFSGVSEGSPSLMDAEQEYAASSVTHFPVPTSEETEETTDVPVAMSENESVPQAPEAEEMPAAGQAQDFEEAAAEQPEQDVEEMPVAAPVPDVEGVAVEQPEQPEQDVKEMESEQPEQDVEEMEPEQPEQDVEEMESEQPEQDVEEMQDMAPDQGPEEIAAEDVPAVTPTPTEAQEPTAEDATRSFVPSEEIVSPTAALPEDQPIPETEEVPVPGPMDVQEHPADDVTAAAVPSDDVVYPSAVAAEDQLLSEGEEALASYPADIVPGPSDEQESRAVEALESELLLDETEGVAVEDPPAVVPSAAVPATAVTAVVPETVVSTPVEAQEEPYEAGLPGGDSMASVAPASEEPQGDSGVGVGAPIPTPIASVPSATQEGVQGTATASDVSAPAMLEETDEFDGGFSPTPLSQEATYEEPSTQDTLPIQEQLSIGEDELEAGETITTDWRLDEDSLES